MRIGLGKPGLIFFERCRLGAEDRDHAAGRAETARDSHGQNLAKQARTLGSLSDDEFEQVVVDARESTLHAVDAVLHRANVKTERKVYTQETTEGCTADDLNALAESSQRQGRATSWPST